MTKKEKFDAVRNSFREKGLTPVCSCSMSDEASDNCPLYGTDCCDLGWWEYALDVWIEKESEVEDL
jgi:hypothetical protein